jgi:hypothetical protein
MKSKITRRPLKAGCIAALLLSLALRGSATELPRKSKTPRESYPNVDVFYDFVTAPHGERLRTIITKPHHATGKLPVIFVAGWLSCDSVEAPPDKEPGPGVVRHDATGLFFASSRSCAASFFFARTNRAAATAKAIARKPILNRSWPDTDPRFVR